MSKTIFKDKSNILIIVLVLIALGLGVAIYKKTGGEIPSIPSLKSSATPTPSRISGPAAQQGRRPTPTGLNVDEKALLNPPREGGTNEERKKHYDLVIKMSQRAEVLNLNSCNKPSPLVFKVEKGQEFKVNNNDSSDHTIIIDGSHKYKISANSTQTIKADFGRGAGSYGYLCDNLSGVVGFFFLIP